MVNLVQDSPWGYLPSFNINVIILCYIINEYDLVILRRAEVRLLVLCFPF